MTNLNEKMKKYRLPLETTKEELECRWHTVVDFGNHVLVAGYFYSGPNANDWFGAVYEHITEDKSCEGLIRLTAISDQHYEDAGHALQWTMTQIR